MLVYLNIEKRNVSRDVTNKVNLNRQFENHINFANDPYIKPYSIKMLISDGINHGKLQSIIVGELKKAGLKHRLKKIILKNVKVSKHFRSQ